MNFPPFDFEFSIRINKDMNACFGPGLCELLKCIQKTSSVKAAAMEMKMSHGRALKKIQISESLLGYPLLIRQIGGIGGGYSHLTDTACRLIDQYTKLEAETNLFVANYMKEHFVGILNK